MSITVDERPHMLLEMLWIREAYELEPQGTNLPPLLLDTPVVVRNAAISADTRGEWEAAWPVIWDAAVAHAGQEGDPRLFEELQSTVDGSMERADLLHRIVGPNWRDHIGDRAFDDSYRTWSQRGMEAHLAEIPTPLDEQPERRDLPALIPAWRAGLTKVVTIPCAGDFIRRVGDNALLTTAAVRENSDNYRRALNTFV